MSGWWVLSLIPAVLIFQNLKQPKLGLEDGRFKALGRKPNAVSTQASDEKRRVDVLDCKGVTSPISLAGRVLSDMPGARVVKEEGPYIYAVFTTPMLRFRDDVELYFDETAQCLHFRSASRAGYSDMGVNYKRYRAFAERFRQLAAG
ncbi:MAG: DUF1499 domain-containing protein [Oleiphilaceae bacterium]|nr:DUF1499 domain-containing protein [Oleiphilaceae bacterium]